MKLNRMKKTFLLTIFVSLYIFSNAQELVQTGNLYTAGEASSVFKKLPEAPDEAMITESIHNIMDNDKNSYPVIRIGNQLWMAENLRTTTFNDGTNIPIVSDNKLWSKMISPGYCTYNNDAGKYKTQYGILYNGYTVSTGKLCPVGWHVPSEAEWLALTNYCGETAAGGKLKKRDNWMSPNTGATNTTGFAALPGGSRGNLGSFMDAGIRGHWWSSSENAKTDFWNRTMSYSNSDVSGSSDHKQSGLSVRCVKNISSSK
jgi:uncharacterized protein (TIGR02145 family)